MANIISYLSSFFYPDQTPSPPLESSWKRQYDSETVEFIVGDIDLDSLSSKRRIEFFEKVNCLYRIKNEIRSEYKENFIRFLKAKKISPEENFEKFRETVLLHRTIFVLVHECVRAGEAFSASIREDGDAKRLAASAELLPEERNDLFRRIGLRLQNPATPVTERIPEVSPEGLDREKRAKAFSEQLRERFPEADSAKLRKIAETYFSTEALGLEDPTDDTFGRIGLIYDHLKEREKRAPYYASLLQLDRICTPEVISDGNKILAACQREIQFDNLLMEMKKIDLYKRYKWEIEKELKGPPRPDLEREEELTKLRDKVILPRIKEDDIGAKLALLSCEESLPAKGAPAAEGAEFYVFPIGNVLSRDPKDTGKWAVVDALDAEEGIDREKIFRALDIPFIEDVLKDQKPYVPVCFEYREGQDHLVQNPKGTIRIFYERQDDVLKSHQDRDFGDKTRLVRDKKKGVYKRVVVDEKGEKKNTSEKVTLTGTKETRTAEVDRLQAIWISRLIAQRLLSGEGRRFDLSAIQSLIEYYGGVSQNDVAARYKEDLCLIEASSHFGAVQELLFRQIQARHAIDLIESHRGKKDRKSDLAHAFNLVKETVGVYRKWIPLFEELLQGMRDYPEMGRDFSWFIGPLESGLREIGEFVSRFPTDEKMVECATDADRQRIIQEVVRQGSSNFNRLTLALNPLQVMENSPSIKEERTKRLKQRFESEAKEYLRDPGPSIQKKLKDKAADPKQLATVARFVQEKFSGKDPTPGDLELLWDEIKDECEEKYPAYREAVGNSLIALMKLYRSVDKFFPQIIQNAIKFQNCFNGLFSDISALTPLHFEIQDSYASVQSSVDGVERLRTLGYSQAKNGGSKDAMDLYFPAPAGASNRWSMPRLLGGVPVVVAAATPAPTLAPNPPSAPSASAPLAVAATLAPTPPSAPLAVAATPAPTKPDLKSKNPPVIKVAKKATPSMWELLLGKKKFKSEKSTPKETEASVMTPKVEKPLPKISDGSTRDEKLEKFKDLIVIATDAMGEISGQFEQVGLFRISGRETTIAGLMAGTIGAYDPKVTADDLADCVKRALRQLRKSDPTMISLVDFGSSFLRTREDYIKGLEQATPSQRSAYLAFATLISKVYAKGAVNKMQTALQWKAFENMSSALALSEDYDVLLAPENLASIKSCFDVAGQDGVHPMVGEVEIELPVAGERMADTDPLLGPVKAADRLPLVGE